MKMKIILMALVSSSLFAIGQSETYKADKYTFRNQLINEKVEIVKTSENFSVTLGNKHYDYQIVSTKPVKGFIGKDYTTLLNHLTYIIRMGSVRNENGMVTQIGIENEWIVDIKLSNISFSYK